MTAFKNWKLFVALAVVVSPFIWNTDSFQELVFPSRYWREEVSKLSASQQMFSTMVTSCTLELEKSQRTADLEIAQLRVNGATNAEAGEIWRTKFQAQAKYCEMAGELYSSNQKKLVAAKRQYLRISYDSK